MNNSSEKWKSIETGIDLKLGAAFGMLVLILIGIGVLGINRLHRANAEMEDILGRRWSNVQLAREALMYSNRNSRITMEIFLLRDRRLIEPLLSTRAENTKKISELVAKIEARCDSPEEKQLLAVVSQTRAPYVGSYLRALHLLLDEKQPEAGRAIMVQETTPALYRYHEAWTKFMQFEMEQLDKAAHESRNQQKHAQAMVLLMVVLAVIASIGIAVPVTLKIQRETRTRIEAEHEVRVLNTGLEQRVEKRTQELAQTNERLSREIEDRKSAEGRLGLQAAALEAAANSIVITDVGGTIIWLNRAFTRLTGYSLQEACGQTPRLLRSGKQDPSFYVNLWETITSGNVWHGELTNRRKDGSLYDEEMTITPVRAQSGEITHFIAIKQDITLRKAIAQALVHAEEKYRALVEDAIVGIFQATPDGRFISANPTMARMHGYDSPQQLMSEVTNAGHDLYVKPTQMQEISKLLEENELVRNVEVEGYRRDGSKRWFLANLRAVRGPDGTIVRHEGTVQDITDRKAAEEQIQFLAYYDGLTGLPNRTLFQDRLTKALASARRRGEKVALLFLDIDNFKTINDSLGHSVGDLLLKELAERLKKWSRQPDTVARLSGDEFVVVLTDVRDLANIAVAADRILKLVTTDFIVQDHLLNVSCSLGISVFPENGTDSETLVKNADAAMYSAKESGNSFRFFTQDMNAAVMERLRLESSLRQAFDRAELFLVYQPQVEITSGKIVGAEALLRWRHPELGLIPPSKFIPIAENSGLIIPIGEWVLRTACTQARQWQKEGFPAIPVAVNVSAVQFRQERFLEVVRKALEENRLSPQNLELELTEGMLLSNVELTLSVLQELKKMGVRLSIDDFGTGYSSLNYLRHFPVHKLKIDRSFVQAITANPDDAAVTDTIIAMGRNLNLKVIAEGVENREQMSFLLAHNCDEAQGYYFSKPLTADDFGEKLLDNSAGMAIPKGSPASFAECPISTR